MEWVSAVSGGGDGWFRIDDIAFYYETTDAFNIISPLNQTYSETMNGYYPGTYSFENENTDLGYNIPEEWILIDALGTNTINIIEELDGHKRIIDFNDISGTAHAHIGQDLKFTQECGTIEFWVYITDAYQWFVMATGNDTIVGNFQIMIRDDLWQYDAAGVAGYTPIPGLSAPQDNTWHHVRIDFECSDGNYMGLLQNHMRVIIDGTASGQLEFNVGSTHISNFHLRTSAGRSGYHVYVDAIGYSWNPHYNVGDNLYEGLLVSFDKGPRLDWMGYSLDNQETVAILGDTVIPMPEDGLHTIQVFGTDSFGIMHQSNIRSFTVNFPIDIITPELKIYKEGMDGYYPATFGFEEFKDGETPTGPNWDTVYSGIKPYVVVEKEGHKNVVYAYDNATPSGNYGNLEHFFNTAQPKGTIEWWWYIPEGYGANMVYAIKWRDSLDTVAISLRTAHYYYQDSNNDNVTLYETKKWVHHKIVFDCEAGTNGQYSWYIDGNLEIINQEMKADVDNINGFDIAGAMNYAGAGFFDAFRYSWDPGYNSSNNMNKGLLLSFDNSTALDWMGYSLDNQANITTLRNSTIPLPEDGPHTIRVYGNDSMGTKYQSNIRHFSVHHISIFSPYSKVYYTPMIGYYPATYGFESDKNGEDPYGWIDGGGGSQIIEEFQGHKNVLEMVDVGTIGITDYLDSARNNGTIEYWLAETDATLSIQNQINKNGVGNCFCIRITSDKFEYFNGTWNDIGKNASDNTWYHIRIDFETTPGIYMGLSQWRWQVLIDGELFGPYNFANNEAPDIVNFYSTTCDIAYADAIGYSWDPYYNIGDNLNEGLLLSFENFSNLNLIGYSLDQHISDKIQGNTTIPFPKDGTHFIQVFGNDTMGNTYSSEIRDFSVNNGSFFNIETPENVSYINPMTGYYPATFGFEDEVDGAYGTDIRFVDKFDESDITEIIVLNELDGHKKVLKTKEAAGWEDTWSDFEDQTYGTIELWMQADDATQTHSFDLRDNNTLVIQLKVESEFFAWRDKDAVWHNIKNCIDDTWYHWRITWQSNDTFDFYIDGVKEVDDQICYNNMTDGIDQFHIKEYDSDAGWYLDAIGYSWDPNYNIGDNRYNGMNFGFRQNSKLNWLGYSLDGQSNRTVFGNITIPFSNLYKGLHTIQIFGEDLKGVIYESEIRYFRVEYPIDMITPENKTYTEPMDGYYPATYGFESDLPLADAKNWTHDVVGGTHSYLVDSYKGHERVYELYDNAVGNPDTYNSYADQSYGTVEVWVLVKISGYVLWVEIFYESSAILTVRLNTAGYLVAVNNTNPIDLTEFGTIKENQWYHLRIDFECGSGDYMGLADDTFRVYLNGTQSNSDFIMNTPSTQANKIRITTGNSAADPNYYAYFDAVGYSWDPNYNIGDNLNEGLLLSYENKTNLESTFYSLDSQSNITIYGNTTFVLPSNGIHTIQVFGNNTLGNIDYSEFRYFTIQNFPIDITTPENITYTDPMSGYYPATYGFENEHIDAIPEEWSSIIVDNQSCHTNINSEIGGHKNVLECFHAINGSWHIRNYFNNTEGTIEFWVMHNSYNPNNILDIIISNSSHYPIFTSYFIGGNYQVYTDMGQITMGTYTINTWHHIRIDFRFKSGNSYLGLNQNEFNIYFDDIFQGTHTMLYSGDPYYLQFMSSWATEEYYSYFDAIGYSWDPDYDVGDNINEGLLLSYSSKYALDWQGFTLDSQPVNTILGNITIPMPSDGVHTVQVIGNDTAGYLRHSSIRYFTVITDITAPVITINLPISNNIFESSPPFFNLTIVEPNLDTMWYTLDGSLTNFIITEPTGHIDNTYWNSRPDGTVSIRFYANDTVGNEDNEVVSVRKDTIPPNVTINSPHHNQEFTNVPPTFTLTIIESNLDEIKYTLDGGLINISIGTSTSGQIDALYWNVVPPGQYTLRFYVSDLVGHHVFADVSIRKLQPRIPGFSVLIISLITSMAIIYAVSKIRRKLN
jgi:hypothetical protein